MHPSVIALALICDAMSTVLCVLQILLIFKLFFSPRYSAVWINAGNVEVLCQWFDLYCKYIITVCGAHVTLHLFPVSDRNEWRRLCVFSGFLHQYNRSKCVNLMWLAY